MQSRRRVLDKILGPGGAPTTHAGLWLDKCLNAQTETEKSKTDDGKGAKAELILALKDHSMPEGYPQALARLRESFEAEPARVLCAPADVQGRMVIGLGAKGVLEAGLHLEHTWGVPILPGSALKGLAASTAHQMIEDDGWRKREKSTKRDRISFDELFGTTDDSGGVIFHDAWWMPGNEHAKLPIHLDVMTVHHPKYYQHTGAGDPPPPSDMDSPIPIPFASVTGRFLVAVEGELAWCHAAMAILKIGLAELGIGAKTNAGYGRMTLDYESPEEHRERQQREEAEKSERARAEQAASEEREARRQVVLARELDGVIGRLEKNNASSLIPDRLAVYSGDLRTAFASRAVKKLTRKWLAEPSRRDQPWVIELLAASGQGAP
jgi:CRISPR-associated protein Cmr6